MYRKSVIITIYMDCRLFGVRIRILSFLLVEKAVTGYSKDVKGVDSADTVIYLLGMFDLESVSNQTFSKTSSAYFGGNNCS